ncbi:NlpC/P60 family protein [Pseudonocardia eucalypti]|uniref:NlpC/P60 family protein n=1 Tax=Pseudonocardia eucalypti TaxID=648755 RepID=A0ABP9RAT6_9PSEU|nr:cell wall-associated NlpC family hydrolase [Pseudonocardia eucalypti]
MHRWRAYARRAAVVVLVATALAASMVGGSGVALADPAPPPTPPPNPSDQQLEQSRQDVTTAAGQVGKLTSQLAEVQAKADQLGLKLQARQESANKALVDLQAAEQDAAAAAARADATRTESAAAANAIEDAHRQLDEFIAVAYQQGAQAGALGLLLEAANPEELVERAELTQAVADQQRDALDALQRARVAKVNADSLARAAHEEARAKQAAAAGAKRTADGAVATARTAVAAGMAELNQVNTQRDLIERQLDTLTSRDAGLRAQRQRYLQYQEQIAAAARAAQAAAAGRVSRGGATGGIQAVIDRAVSQVGVSYAWGGGNSGGPTKGIKDGGVADSFGDFRKTGFDCSGLMIYAFGAAGIGLPHFSGYQANKGQKVPISQIRPGDMLFWADDGGVHHVALYLGDDQMVEAPYSGGKVRITPLRRDGLLPYARRLI